MLEDLRLLTDHGMDAERHLCLLLAGLTELRRQLTMAVHESLAQRIVVRYYVSGLTREELPAYLDTWKGIDGMLSRFAPAECANDLHNAGYVSI